MKLELQNACEWTKANKITVNPPKPHVLTILPKSTHQISSVKVYTTLCINLPLAIKDFVKYVLRCHD